MTKFITSNPILVALIVIGVIALIIYAIKKNAKGSTNSPNNAPPADGNNTNATQKLRELVVVNGKDELLTNLANGMGGKNIPATNGATAMVQRTSGVKGL